MDHRHHKARVIKKISITPQGECFIRMEGATHHIEARVLEMTSVEDGHTVVLLDRLIHKDYEDEFCYRPADGTEHWTGVAGCYVTQLTLSREMENIKG